MTPHALALNLGKSLHESSALEVQTGKTSMWSRKGIYVANAESGLSFNENLLTLYSNKSLQEMKGHQLRHCCLPKLKTSDAV